MGKKVPHPIPHRTTHLRAPPGDHTKLGRPHQSPVRANGQTDRLDERREFSRPLQPQEGQVRANLGRAGIRMFVPPLHPDALLTPLFEPAVVLAYGFKACAEIFSAFLYSFFMIKHFHCLDTAKSSKILRGS